MKTCSRCGVSKNLTEFYGAPRNKDKLQGVCKKCFLKTVKKYQDSSSVYKDYQWNRKHINIKWIYRNRYDTLKRRAEGYYKHMKHSSLGKPVLSLEQFEQWCVENEAVFMTLWKAWKKSGWQRALTPSIDRIDNDLGYVPENMQWLALVDNMKKGRKSANV